eukprot:TRINITY_DN28378_c0_g1_i1.p1 TRINITY_DN28378_c0_g1~~TRINITY_DN28378_c0_g1_i1.p1  ORF type:complete len:608 (-),score=147.85 TRINITY_DN28378_c0_g1_i1:102-1925(-)
MLRQSAPASSAVAAAGLVGVAFAMSTLGCFSAWTRRAELKAKAQKKRGERDCLRQRWKELGFDWQSVIAWAAQNAKGRLHPVEVIELSASALLAKMEDRTLSSEYIVRCFIGRALAVGEELDMNAEEFFEEALEDAVNCDQERAAGRLRGCLHGLPISVKDQLHQRNADSTCGLSVRCGVPHKNDGLVVAVLREQGAIPFVRTNIPQCLMLPESFNAIWGTSKNPFDMARSVGGSSGGEGGLLAARGSPLGLGSDIGGSIRIPASMCGIAGFKPTVGRLTKKGAAIPRPNDLNGQSAIKSTVGPMGRSVDDLALLMKAWCSPLMYAGDKTIPVLPWDSQAYDRAKGARKMTFGFFVHDGFFDPAPACRRAVLETVDALRRDGHKVVEFPAEEMRETALLYLKLMAADGGMNGFIRGLEGETLHEYYAFLYKIANLPNLARKLATHAYRALGQKRVADLVAAGGSKSAREHWEDVARRDRLRETFMERWEKAGIDALLCPALAVSAMPHGASVKLNQACSYTFVWNNFDFPAGVVPVTTVQKDEENYESSERDDFTSFAKKATQGSAGLPVGVQVVTLPWRDEQCMGALHIVERLAKFSYPLPPHPKL